MAGDALNGPPTGHPSDEEFQAIFRRLRAEVEMLRGHHGNGQAGGPPHHPAHLPPAGLPDQLVTLSQAAAMVHRQKESLRWYRGRGLPDPAVRGKRGQPSLWSWKKIRPWLETTFGIRLPESFPGSAI